MSELQDLVGEELSLPVDPRVGEMAAAIAAEHGEASRAVLFYGSSLREKRLDGLLLDFYLIVSDYRSAYAKRWLAVANRLIPPNVFYFENGGLAGKYAVLSEADFARLCGPETSSVSVWARFAQPSRLVWAEDEPARQRSIDAVARAAPTLLAGGRAKSRGGATRSLATSFRTDLFGGVARRAEGTQPLGRRPRTSALRALHQARA